MIKGGKRRYTSSERGGQGSVIQDRSKSHRKTFPLYFLSHPNFYSVLGSIPNTLHAKCSQDLGATPEIATIVVPILQMRKLRLSTIPSLPRDPTASKRRLILNQRSQG